MLCLANEPANSLAERITCLKITLLHEDTMGYWWCLLIDHHGIEGWAVLEAQLDDIGGRVSTRVRPS